MRVVTRNGDLAVCGQPRQLTACSLLCKHEGRWKIILESIILNLVTVEIYFFTRNIREACFVRESNLCEAHLLFDKALEIK